jgi:hypothetical protein
MEPGRWGKAAVRDSAGEKFYRMICRIGIDPAFRKKGFCVCIIDEDRTARFITFTSFLDFLDWLGDAPDNAIVTVENSNLQNVTFAYKGSKQSRERISRNVGANQAASQYTVDACMKRWGKDKVRGISPAQKGAKWNKTLFKAVLQQERITKTYDYTGSQDQRDAFQLAVKPWPTYLR